MYIINKKTSLFLSAVLLLLSWHSMAQDKLQDNECDSIKKLTVYSMDDFNSLKSSKTNDKEWSSTFVIPGSKTCYIRKSKRVTFECKSRELDLTDDAILLRNARADAIKSCLGPAWNIYNEFSEYFIDVRNPDDNVSVSVAADHDGPIEKYYLLTTIMRLNQVRLEDAPKNIESMPSPRCDDISRFVSYSKNQFQDLVNASEKHDYGNRVHWSIKSPIREWNSCFVHEWNGKSNCRYASCELGLIEDQVQAAKLMRRVVADIKACLGQRWKANNINKVEMVHRQEISGTRLVGDGIIELYPSQSVLSDAWNLHMQISSDVCSP